MKKKYVYIIGGVLVLILLIIGVLLFSNKSSCLIEEAAKNSGKEVTDYKKFLGGDVLNENTHFNEYTFISNNNAYIFDPSKLKSGELSYKKVYDIPSELEILNIGIPMGADITFITKDDIEYKLNDINTDNKVEDNYGMFNKANYKLDKFYDSYSMGVYKTKFDYDFVFNNHMIKDNVIYKLSIPWYDILEKKDYPFTKEKISGNYEGEKILNVYNDRIIKTDKAFYEVVDYYKDNTRTSGTLKMTMLSKYYDEVLTFTYEYVVLKDYTLIPIKDTFVNRNKKYVEYFYKDCFEEEIKDFNE